MHQVITSGNAERRALLLLPALVVLSLLFASCQGRGAECVISVGAILSLTGEFGEEGREQLRGYQMAVCQINAGGGDGAQRRVKLDLIVRDDRSDPNQAAIKAKELIEDKKVSMLLGATTSTTTIPVSGVAEAYKVPFLIPSATTDLITTQGYNWVFRICAPSEAFAAKALDFVQDSAKKDPGLDVATMAIIYGDSDFGNATAVAAARQAMERDIRVVAYEVYKRGRDDDVSEMLRRVKEAAPDALFYAINHPSDAATLTRLSRCVGLTPQWVIAGEGGFAVPQFLQEAGSSTEGVFVVTQWNDDVAWNGACHFVADYRETYGDGEGPVPMLSAEAYAAIQVAYGAIEQAARQGGAPTAAPTSTRAACTRVPVVDGCTPLPIAEGCTPVPAPKEPAGTATLMPTPSCASIVGGKQRGCPKAQAIRDALSKVDMDTIFGHVRFDARGQSQHTGWITQAQCGALVSVPPPE